MDMCVTKTTVRNWLKTLFIAQFRLRNIVTDRLDASTAVYTRVGGVGLAMFLAKCSRDLHLNTFVVFTRRFLFFFLPSSDFVLIKRQFLHSHSTHSEPPEYSLCLSINPMNISSIHLRELTSKIDWSGGWICIRGLFISLSYLIGIFSNKICTSWVVRSLKEHNRWRWTLKFFSSVVFSRKPQMTSKSW